MAIQGAHVAIWEYDREFVNVISVSGPIPWPKQKEKPETWRIEQKPESQERCWVSSHNRVRWSVPTEGLISFEETTYPECGPYDQVIEEARNLAGQYEKDWWTFRHGIILSEEPTTASDDSITTSDDEVKDWTMPQRKSNKR